jgi:hypothetical protein
MYPNYTHINKGNIKINTKGEPEITGGMHTQHSLGLLLKKNKTYSDYLLDETGHIKAKFNRQYPNGVREVRFPLLDKNGELIKSSKGGYKTIGKNLFPSSWDANKIIKSINEIKNTTIPKQLSKTSDGTNVLIYEGVVDGVRIKAVISESGDLVTAFPAPVRTEGSQVLSVETY